MGGASRLLIDEQSHAGRQRGQLLGLGQFVLGIACGIALAASCSRRILDKTSMMWMVAALAFAFALVLVPRRPFDGLIRVTLGLLLGVATLPVALFVEALSPIYDSIPFHAETWRAAEAQATVRHEMVGDLIGSEVLVGKSRAQVIELLGDCFGPPPFPVVPKSLNYNLGRADSMRAWAVDWLVVKFDNAGLVDKSYIYMD